MKQLYQGVLGKLRELHPGWRMFGGKIEGLERQVEQEMLRRRALGNQLTQLLDSQLQILRVEMRAQQAMQKSFRARMRESARLLRLLAEGQTSLWDKHIKQQYVMERQICICLFLSLPEKNPSSNKNVVHKCFSVD